MATRASPYPRVDPIAYADTGPPLLGFRYVDRIEERTAPAHHLAGLIERISPCALIQSANARIQFCKEFRAFFTFVRQLLIENIPKLPFFVFACAASGLADALFRITANPIARFSMECLV